MANSDAAFGLRPVRDQAGGVYNGAVNRYYVPDTDSTAIYIGGLVKLAGSGDADGIPSVTGNVSTGDGVVGVVVGVEPVTHESLIYRAASTERYVFVADDPNQLFEVQEDSDSATLAAADIGEVADLVNFTSGSTTSGLSSIEVNSDTATASYTAGTSDHDVELVRVSQKVGNAIGANAVWEVRLLNHIRGNNYNRNVGA